VVRIKARECIVDLLLKDGNPVDATKPTMFLDVVDSVLEVAIPLAQVRLQQVSYDIFHVATEMRRKPNLQTKCAVTKLIDEVFSQPS